MRRTSLRPRRSSRVPSTEPLSATMISKSRKSLWASDSRHGSITRRQSSETMQIDSAGIPKISSRADGKRSGSEHRRGELLALGAFRSVLRNQLAQPAAHELGVARRLHLRHPAGHGRTLRLRRLGDDDLRMDGLADGFAAEVDLLEELLPRPQPDERDGNRVLGAIGKADPN